MEQCNSISHTSHSLYYFYCTEKFCRLRRYKRYQRRWRGTLCCRRWRGTQIAYISLWFCFRVLQFNVLHFHVLQFGPSFSCPAFSRLAFSAPQHKLQTWWMLIPCNNNKLRKSNTQLSNSRHPNLCTQCLNWRKSHISCRSSGPHYLLVMKALSNVSMLM